MPKRGTFKTALKYLTGIAVLAVSVAAAWFLPGLYADWQDARLTGQPVLSHRDGIAFLDTASLDIVGRLQMLEEQSDSFTWVGVSEWMNPSVLESSIEKAVARGRAVMAKWCEAGLFPEGCLACIDMDRCMLYEPLSIYLGNTAFSACLLHFSNTDGYAATLILDMDVDLIYYASVCGPAMLDVFAMDMGFDSFPAMAEYVKEVLEEADIDPLSVLNDINYDTEAFLDEEIGENVKLADSARYDFAAVCGAREAKVTQPDSSSLTLAADLPFDRFTGHAYRVSLLQVYDEEVFTPGFAYLYGSDRWLDVVDDVVSGIGFSEEAEDPEPGELYSIGLLYLFGDSEIRDEIGYPTGPAGTETEISSDD